MGANRQALSGAGVLEPRQSAGSERPGALETTRSSTQVFELVCRHMRTLVGPHDPEYEDLVQAAAERVLRDLDGFRGDSRLTTWVYRVCYTTLLTHRRWYKRWLKRFALSASGNLPEDAAPVLPAVDHDLDGQRRAARLHVAIAGLSEKRRVVVVLHDLQGFGVQDIAQIVEANVLTVRSRLRDGRRDLARRLRADPFFGDQACGEVATDREPIDER